MHLTVSCIQCALFTIMHQHHAELHSKYALISKMHLTTREYSTSNLITSYQCEKRFFLLRDVTRSIYLRIKSLVRILSALQRYGLIIRMYRSSMWLFTIDKLMSGSSLEGKEATQVGIHSFRQICSTKP